MSFKFDLGQQEITIIASGETGQVIARIDYINSESQYLLRYKSNAGTAEEKWWPESALTAD